MLTFNEVCDRLRISPKTLRKLIVSGDLRAARVGRAWRISEDDLAAYLENQSVRASA